MKAKSKYVTEFNQIGFCKVDVDLVCKDWNKKFMIVVYKSTTIEFTLFIEGRAKGSFDLKAKISPEQAKEITYKLELREVKSNVFASGSTLYSRETIAEKMISLCEKQEELASQIKQISDIWRTFFKAEEPTNLF
jgi:hypothetical protein